MQHAAELEGGRGGKKLPRTEGFSLQYGEILKQVRMDLSNFPPKSRSGGGGARLDLEGRMKHLRNDQMTRTDKLRRQ